MDQKASTNEEPELSGLDKAAFEIPNAENLKFFSKLSPHLQTQINEVLINEKAIISHLENAENAALFKKSPLEFLERSEIKIPALVAARLRKFDFEKEYAADSYVLPNGSVITPKVKINFKLK